MKIICIGQTTYDITYYTDCYPVENTKVKNHDLLEAPGGSAFNMTALLNKWGKQTSLVSVVGNDTYGSNIIKCFQTDNIDETYLQKNNGHTSLASIICNQANNTRTVMVYHDQSLDLNNTNLDFNPDLIIGDGHFPDVFRSIVNMYPNAISMLDAGRYDEETVSLAKLVNYMVCSKDFAELATGIKIDLDNKESIVNIFHALAKDFTKTNVITLEKNGSIVSHDNSIYLIPSIKVDEVDTTGAGDLYHGAFAYGITEEWPLAKIMKVANITGALSTTTKGSYNAIPDLDEVLKKYEETC